MDTIIKNELDENGNIIGMKVTDNDENLASCLASMSRNNTFVPGISRILYNDPVTKVWFKDGTSVTLKTSKGDTFSKEIGLCYAIIKRVMGKPDGKGEVHSDGFMNKLKKFVDSAYDQKAENVVDEKKPETKTEPPKPKKPSLAKTVEDLSKTVSDLSKVVESLLPKENPS